ncbi:MAG TPA: EboA domain-containing protein [Planctomycetota bacterium]|nr:EboA domain-containing protein [Planctomycetota bacterium]
MTTTLPQDTVDPLQARALFADWLAPRLPGEALATFESWTTALASGVSHTDFCVLLSRACRLAGQRPLAPSAAECAAAEKSLPGLNPERWTELETLRVALVLARNDLDEDSAVDALEEAFRYADMGELCALYRSLAWLPAGGRFAWRCGEGHRTNMVSVFEANALDTPYPATHLDDTALFQIVIKCLHLSGPLWRLWGLDGRVNGELARMALDLADERSSALRPVQPMLWLCLGKQPGERGAAWLARELSEGSAPGRRGAALGCARAGRPELLENALDRETEPLVRGSIELALAGAVEQGMFAALETDDEHEKES